MCNPRPLSSRGAQLPTKFSKGGGGAWQGEGLEDLNFQRWGDFFQMGCNFCIKNKVKSEIFNDKKSLQAKIFFSAITKNSNWEILPKNLITLSKYLITFKR